MVQCVVCEDWYHESCLNLRTRPKERSPTPERSANETNDVGDMDSNASNDLPSPLLSSSTYESLICGRCVLGNDTLRRWAGTPGIMMVIREDCNEPSTLIEDGGVDPLWKVLNGKAGVRDVLVGMEKDERKRECEDEALDVCEDEERAAKKPRTDSTSSNIPLSVVSSVSQIESRTPCLAPPVNFMAQQVLNHILHPNPTTREKGVGLIGKGDIFLTEGWRERWCRCPKVPFSLFYM